MIANLRRFLAVIPAVAIALLHAGTCPACWPLLGGLVSSIGLTFLIETQYRLPLMIGCLAIAVSGLSYGARREYRPLVMGLSASGVILVGEFVVDTDLVTVGGVGLLVGAYLWSFWLRRADMQSPCQTCSGSTTTAEESGTPKLADIPIACALNQTQFAKRKRLLDRLAQQAIKRRRLPNGVSLCFAANSGRVTELAKFVDLERDCCPFLTFRIDVGAGESIWLKLTGPPAARELILGLIPEAASNG
jgi:hypothetical protein